jgi:coenzyme F420-reducing hydrogenase gamma subunit
MAPKKNKLKFAFISLTSCEGCYCEFLGLREKFLELKDIIEIVDFRLFEDDHYFTAENLDVVFVEGSPLTKENVKNLKELRAVSKVLIACGSCAHIGGIYHLKNYSDKDKLLNHVYTQTKGIDNLEVKPISEYVAVDFSLPQCPINKDEILKFIYQLVIGKNPKIPSFPVCFECLLNGYECLLQKGEICFGAITQGGCGAICPKSKQACWGCRGLHERPQSRNLYLELKKRGYTQSEIDKVAQVFGIKNQIDNQL